MSKRLNWKHFKRLRDRCFNHSIIYRLLTKKLPHTHPYYLPVEDSTVLHIDNFFTLSLIIIYLSIFF
jgi:hypothetical protein